MRMNAPVRNNGRQRTNKAWRDVNFDALDNDPLRGVHYRYDFFERNFTPLTSDGQNADFQMVQATSGTAALKETEEGGWLVLDSNSTSANQGPTLFFPSTLVIPTANRLIVFGGRLRAKDIAGSGLQMFLGLLLASLDTTPVTAEAPAAGATDYVGFYTTGNASTVGKVFFAAEDGGTQDLNSLTVHTFLDGDTVTDGTEIVKLECRINGLESIEIYVNGVETLHDVGVAAIPEGTPLRLAIACLTGDEGTESDSITEWDWVEVISQPK